MKKSFICTLGFFAMASFADSTVGINYRPIQDIDADIRDAQIASLGATMRLTLQQPITQLVGKDHIYFENGRIVDYPTNDQPHCVLHLRSTSVVRDFKVGRSTNVMHISNESGTSTEVLAGMDPSISSVACYTVERHGVYPVINLRLIESMLDGLFKVEADVQRVVGSRPSDRVIAITPASEADLGAVHGS